MTDAISDTWQPHFHQKSDLFSPVIPAFDTLNHKETHWPTLAAFQLLLNAHKPKVLNQLNNPIQFVEQGSSFNTFEEQYEPRIYLKGEVQTRLNNWHDFFQVLVWYTFPKSKVTLNTLHYEASTQRLAENSQNNQRTKIENFLTLFDECGIVIVSQDIELLDFIREFQWPSLFWEHREAFDNRIECFTFGHAMYEKALNPYIGMTANAMLIHVKEDFFDMPYANKLSTIDEYVTKRLVSESPLNPNKLNPFPLLGVPNWHNENNTLDFYLNEAYFRRGRRQKKTY